MSKKPNRDKEINKLLNKMVGLFRGKKHKFRWNKKVHRDVTSFLKKKRRWERLSRYVEMEFK